MHFNMRLDEMAVDPVVSSEQSAAEVRKKMAEFKMTICGREPTTSKDSAVINGSFVLVSAPGRHGVELARVCALPRGVGVYSLDAYCITRFISSSTLPKELSLVCSEPGPQAPSLTNTIQERPLKYGSKSPGRILRSSMLTTSVEST